MIDDAHAYLDDLGCPPGTLLARLRMLRQHRLDLEIAVYDAINGSLGEDGRTLINNADALHLFEMQDAPISGAQAGDPEVGE